MLTLRTLDNAHSVVEILFSALQADPGCLQIQPNKFPGDFQDTFNKIPGVLHGSSLRSITTWDTNTCSFSYVHYE